MKDDNYEKKSRLLAYWDSLTVKGRKAFCDRAGITYNYARIHLMQDPPGRGASSKKQQDIATATSGKVSRLAVMKHFDNAKRRG